MLKYNLQVYYERMTNLLQYFFFLSDMLNLFQLDDNFLLEFLDGHWFIVFQCQNNFTKSSSSDSFYYLVISNTPGGYCILIIPIFFKSI